MKSLRVWCEILSEKPRSLWWPKLSRQFSDLAEMELEKWDLAQTKWQPILDSSRSFSLFAKKKILLIQSAEKIFKGLKSDELQKRFEEIQDSPHSFVFQSSEAAPEKWPFESWRYEVAEDNIDDKTVFRWIDAIQAGRFQSAIEDLENGIRSGQHPFACLQLLGRHFRIGRLVQYATRKGLSEAEISRQIKIHKFVIQKWKRSKALSETQWRWVFQKLAEMDLELKSGKDSLWSLRQLSFDLIRAQNPSKSARL